MHDIIKYYNFCDIYTIWLFVISGLLKNGYVTVFYVWASDPNHVLLTWKVNLQMYCKFNGNNIP